MDAGPCMWFWRGETRGRFLSSLESPPPDASRTVFAVSLLDVFVTGLRRERDSGMSGSMSMISEFFADGMIPWSPILLSLKVAGLATAASFCAGVAAAWLLARRRSPFSAVLDAMCTLPMILPPTVLGYYLILLVGRRGVIGPWLAECGINLIFSWQGAVVAATVVVFPLIYKSARAALELVDPRLENAARTLGASEWKVFWQVSLPLAWRGIVAGGMLAFARGMGEFGATLMIAGNIPGKTQTLALAIYDAFQAGNDEQATVLVVLTSCLCLTILVLADRLFGGKAGGR